MFKIHRTSVFRTWLNFMYYQFKEMDLFLTNDIIDMYMPEDFKSKFPNTRIAFDATEVKINKPSNLADQRATWSYYKNSNMVKVMVGISPRGVVTYISPVYGGSCSDRQIIEISDLLKKKRLTSGDAIMTDRRILVQDLFANQNVKVNTPTPMRRIYQFQGATAINERKIYSKRIHVERIIGLAKTYKILQGEHDRHKTHLVGRIIYVCFIFCNFTKNIVSQSA
uniref:Putative LOC100637207 [Amphimedon queenslandica] n=1 Tax=Lepeophtheirus salmonis TaxID=72036 RepID=A0A0K2V1A9_LEPSM